MRHPRCRIVYLIGELHRGGQERQLYYLLLGMDRAKHNPAVVVWNYDDADLHVGRIRALGVPVYGITAATTRLGKLAAFRRLVAELSPDVVHSYSFHTNVAAAWATAGVRSVAVGSIRSDFSWAKRGSGPVLGRLSARWPAFHISNSHSAAETVRRSRGLFAPQRYAVVPNGMDLDRFPSCPIDMSGPARILGLGYLRPVKRWDRLLHASCDLVRDGCDHRVAICGGGPAQASLQELAARLDIADRVTFMDHTDDVTRPLAGCTCAVLTSELEGCPNAVMEAMACGRAVVATDVGDVGRLVEDGRTGYLVPSGDHAALVSRLAALVRNRDLCVTMGAAARRKAEEEFGLERFVALTLGAYRDAGWKDELASGGSAVITSMAHS